MKDKIKIISIIMLLLLIVSTCGCVNQNNNIIKISGAFALYPMMGIWAEEYQKLHPEIKIDLSAGGAGKGMADALLGVVDLGMVSREIYQEEIDQGVFWVSVVIDAVVATMNSNNPAADILKSRGVTREEFIDIFITGNISNWGELIGDANNKDTINVYSRSDSCGAAQTWALYLGDYTQDDLTNNAKSAINGDPNLAAAIQNDVNGIGFNNINFVYDPNTKEPYVNIITVPIDIDGNGYIDENEDFYNNRTSIIKAINDKVYPSPPARALHLVTKENFKGITKDFVYWILTDGQQYVSEGGYIQLSPEIIEDQIEYLETGVRPEISK